LTSAGFACRSRRPDPRPTGPSRSSRLTSRRASLRLVDASAVACAPYLGWLELLDCLDEPLAQVFWAHSGITRPRGQLASKAPFVILEAAWDRAASALRTLDEAFSEVCRAELGLEPDVLLRAHAPHVRWTKGPDPGRRFWGGCSPAGSRCVARTPGQDTLTGKPTPS